MGRAPCCDKANVKKGPWSPEEDAKLLDFMDKFGTCGSWISLPQKAGLKRCGKSCRLRWLNYLRPNIKHGEFSDDEDRIICSLYASIGSRWSIIAAQLPGRTDNDIKNYWNTKLKKKLTSMIMTDPLRQYEIKSSQFSPSILHQSPISQSSYHTPIEPHTISNPQINPYNSTLPTNHYNSLFQSPNYPFGEPSCSSSNGSSTSSNFNVVQIKQEEQMGLFRPNGLEENYQNLVFGNNGIGVLDQISNVHDVEEGLKELNGNYSINEGLISKNYVERGMYCNYYY